MSTQNAEFLKNSLLNLGFGDELNTELVQQMNRKMPEFILSTAHVFNQQKVSYDLHFKAGSNEGVYFFNKFDATIEKGGEQELKQTFFIYKGSGVTVKEAFNLMEGRSVHKQLFNKEGDKYQAWLKLDNDNLTEKGNKQILTFGQNYGYYLEEVLTGKGIKEMETVEGQENLFRSLKKGNAQQITVEREGIVQKYFIAASPHFKTIDLFDDKMKKIKREELLQPRQEISNNPENNQRQKGELPAKKQSRKTKMRV